MSEERTAKRVRKNTPEGKRSVGKPRKERINDGENDQKKTDIRNCRKIAEDRDAWKLILQETVERVDRE
jgi:hypothetical protein